MRALPPTKEEDAFFDHEVDEVLSVHINTTGYRRIITFHFIYSKNTTVAVA